ncbi:MAG: hypothetical protein M3P41_02370 [Actinomycetota bacterium]|nr:hypothetical protein [Actinomycetota bacterium]
MYGTVRVYGASGDLVDRLLENESEVKGVVSGIEGFKAYYLIRTADGTASISVYETEDGAAESNKAAAAWIKERLPDFAGDAPQVFAGEVVISG